MSCWKCAEEGESKKAKVRRRTTFNVVCAFTVAFLLLLFAFRIVALPRANSELRLGGHANFDAEEVTAGAFVVGVILEQVLRAQLRGDAIKDGVQVSELVWDEG